MTDAIRDPKYTARFQSGTTPDEQRDTLIEGGPLTVGPASWFKHCFPSYTEPYLGEFEYSMHHMEYVWLDVFDWPDEAMERGVAWFLKPKRVTRFLQRADSLGLLKWTVWASEEEAIAHLRWVKKQLPPDEHGFTQDDMMEYPEESPITTLTDRVRAIMFKDAGDIGMTAAVDYKTMLCDGYVKTRRDDSDGHYQSMLAVLLDAASPNNLSSKPLAVQASTVIRFIATTQPPRALRRYLPYYMQEQEIARRTQTESGQFIPLLIAAHDAGRDGGFAELKMALPHACTGAAFVEFVKLLAVRAKFQGEITSTTCTAICDMLRGELLHELNTEEMRSPISGSNQIRASRLGDLLASIATRPPGDDKKSGSDKAAAEKMRTSQWYTTLTSALEAHVTDTPDYKAVIILLASTAVGRIFLSGGAAASPIMNKFTAAKQHTLLDEALNKILAVDEDGTPLGKFVIKLGTAILLIKGKFGPLDFDPWMHLCYLVILARDGAEAANALSNERHTFWSDYDRLVLCKPIMTATMGFVGHQGRSAGSYISFHDGMTSRARKVKSLPSNFLKKAGLAKKLASIGEMVMTSQAAQDGVTIMEPIGIAHIRQPFFSPDFLAHSELTIFDKDLEEARSKMRLHEDYGDDEDDNFRRAKKPRNGDSRTSDDRNANLIGSADKPPGHMLDLWSVWLTAKGPIFGCKFLVDWSAHTRPGDIPHSACIGSLSYLNNEKRRKAWCSNRNCTHHHRPNRLPEQAFKVINVHAENNTAADAITAASVLSDQRNWVHWAGPKSHDILGGKGGHTRPANSNDATSRGKGSGKGSRGERPGGGHAKGSGGGGGGDKGKGQGKGKARGTRGKGTSSFGRQH